MSNRNNILDIWYNHHNQSKGPFSETQKKILEQSVKIELFLDKIATTPMPPAQGTSLDEFYKILLSSLIIKTDFYYFGTNYNIYNPTIIQEMIAAVEKMESVIKDALNRETVEEIITLYYEKESLIKHQQYDLDLTDDADNSIAAYVNDFDEKYKQYFYQINTGNDFRIILNELNSRVPGLKQTIIQNLKAKYPFIEDINESDDDFFLKILKLSIVICL